MKDNPIRVSVCTCGYFPYRDEQYEKDRQVGFRRKWTLSQEDHDKMMRELLGPKDRNNGGQP